MSARHRINAEVAGRGIMGVTGVPGAAEGRRTEPVERCKTQEAMGRIESRPQGGSSSVNKRRLVVGAALVSLVMGLVIGHAAALQLNVRKLAAFNYEVEIEVPEVVAWDHFGGSGNLHGSPSPVGGTWEVISGGWEYQGDSAVQVQSNSPNALAVLDTGLSDDLYIETGLGSISTHPTASGAGISFFSAGTNLRMQAVYNRSTQSVILAKRATNGSVTTLGTAAGQGLHSSAVIGVEIDQPQIRVYFNGSLVITYNMTGAEQTTYGSNTRHGITALQDKGTQFDWFMIEELN